jgi:predicted CoA-binding protein
MNDSQELEEIRVILSSAKTIAVVGISHNINRPSREIAEFLVKEGYKVVGVNPGIKFAGEIPVYPDLKSIPFEVDIVDVFRKSEEIPSIIQSVLEKNPKVLWLQQGIRNDEAVKPVLEKGIKVIQDKCIAVYYRLCYTAHNNDDN